ncbi:MAG: hypothetical protein AB7N65_07350 [Vicinamibacterales bacterium]
MAVTRSYFVAEPLGPANLDACRPLWGDRAAWRAADFERMLERVRRWLACDRARGRLLRDEHGRPRAFGVSVFVSPAVADRLATTTSPQLGRQLLEDEACDASVLGPREVARGNAGAGLQLLVVNQGYDDSGLHDDEWATLLGQLIHAFLETHTGFRVSRAIIETFGRRGVAFVAESWPGVTCADVVTVDGLRLPSARWTVTQASAERQGGGLLPLFLYRPPTLGLSHAERVVLAAALTFGTDTAIAEALRLPLATVKGRWSRIFRRVASTPIGDRLSASKAADRRGPQSRHILLEYLRRNPWELTGYDRSGKTMPEE